VEPAHFTSIATAAMAAGGVIFCGALYAIFYAMGRRVASSRLLGISFVAYAGVVACVGVLTFALDFTGIWWLLIVCLLIGYLLAPPFIWRLTVAVHANERIRFEEGTQYGKQ